VFQQVHAALQARYHSQVLEKAGTHTGQKWKLTDDPHYSAAFKAVQKQLTESSRARGHKDPQSNTLEDTFDFDGFHKVCITYSVCMNFFMLNDPCVALQLIEHMMGLTDSAAIRDMANCLWLFSTLGRSNDGREMYLADLIKPTHLKGVSKYSFLAMCTSALCMYVCSPLPLVVPSVCSPLGLRINLKKYFKEADIETIVKVTHAFRVAGARYLDDLGLEDVVCTLHSLVGSLGCC
jgi:hypothetical protein